MRPRGRRYCTGLYGAFAQEVIPSTVTNAKAMYWKGDCPVRSEYTPTVVIGEEH